MSNLREVFISYRRSDSADITGRIFDRLKDEFGEETVFRDIDSIPFGADFTTHIKNELGACKVALVMIGPDWLTVTDEHGKRRIESANDYVRVEIEAALSRKPPIPCIPILVQGA